MVVLSCGRAGLFPVLDPLIEVILGLPEFLLLCLKLAAKVVNLLALLCKVVGQSFVARGELIFELLFAAEDTAGSLSLGGLDGVIVGGKECLDDVFVFGDQFGNQPGVLLLEGLCGLFVCCLLLGEEGRDFLLEEVILILGRCLLLRRIGVLA